MARTFLAATPASTATSTRISSFFMAAKPRGRFERCRSGHADAEVDGNRTRRTGIACPTRFEGGGCHQVS